MVRVGFIGFGKFAQTRKECLEPLKEAMIIGFYDPAYSGSLQVDGVRSFPTAESLMSEVDAVVISVPPKLAPRLVIAALANRKHVFCEKPAAVSFEDLYEIFPHLDPSLVLAYGFNHRQHPSVIAMKQILIDKELGSVLWMRGRYGKEVGEEYRHNWRCDYTLNGGGILIDQGIHMVDLMSHLVGGFDGAQAVLSNGYLNIENVEDNAFITLFNRTTGISASVHSTITQWRYLFSLEVFCEKGSIVLNGLRTKSGSYGDEVLTIKPNGVNLTEGRSREIRYQSNTSWTREMSAFISSVQGHTEYPYATFNEACETTKLMDLIYENAEWI